MIIPLGYFTVTLLARFWGLSGAAPLSIASWYARIWMRLIWVMGFRSATSGTFMKKSNTGLFLWLTPMMYPPQVLWRCWWRRWVWILEGCHIWEKTFTPIFFSLIIGLIMCSLCLISFFSLFVFLVLFSVWWLCWVVWIRLINSINSHRCEGELEEISGWEERLSVDPLNLIQVMLAEG